MSQSTINRIVADALAWHMDKAGVTAQQLGRKAKVSDRTVANFLFPDRRAAGSKGKEPSGKLTELALIAEALGVEFADLVTEATPEQREERRRLTLAAHVLRTGQVPPQAASGKPHREAA